MNLAAIKELRGIPIGQVLTFDHRLGGGIVLTSAAKILDANPQRVAILGSTAAAGAVYLGFDNSVAAGNGVIIPASSQVTVFSDDIAPGLAGREMWAVAASTAVVFGFIEVLLVD